MKDEVRKAVEAEKKKLRAQTRRLGYPHENFGQKSIRELNDKYFGLAYGDYKERDAYKLVADFEDWCYDYTGEK